MGFYRRQEVSQALRFHPSLQILDEDDGHALLVADLGLEGACPVEIDDDGAIRVVDEAAAGQQDRGE